MFAAAIEAKPCSGSGFKEEAAMIHHCVSACLPQHRHRLRDPTELLESLLLLNTLEPFAQLQHMKLLLLLAFGVEDKLMEV